MTDISKEKEYRNLFFWMKHHLRIDSYILWVLLSTTFFAYIFVGSVQTTREKFEIHVLPSGPYIKTQPDFKTERLYYVS